MRSCPKARDGIVPPSPYAPTVIRPEHASEVAAAFSLGDGATLSGPVARGEVGQVWRLSTDLGLFAVKEPFEPIPVDEVREHADFQEAAHAAGIPSPAVIRSGDGSPMVDIGGAQVRVFEWVEMRDRDPDVDPAEVGTIVAAIHRLPFSGVLPTDPWYTEPVGGDRWDVLASTLQANDAPFGGRLAAMRDELVALESLIEPADDLRTCHRDLWADNVLRTVAGPLCVIDWENCGLADPVHELAAVLFEFGRGGPDRSHTLYRAYVDAGGPGRIDHPGDFSMLIAQLGHIGEDACLRWLDPTESEAERRHQAARAEEFLDLPLTRAVIQELLEAIAP